MAVERQPEPALNVARTDARLHWTRLHLWQIQGVRDVLLVAAIVGLIWFGYALRTVTVPLLIALLLAYLVEPIVARLSSHPKLNRPLVVGGMLCAMLAVLTLTVAIGVPLVVGQTIQFVKELRSGYVQRGIIAGREYVPESFLPQYDAAAETVNEWIGGSLGAHRAPAAMSAGLVRTIGEDHGEADVEGAEPRSSEPADTSAESIDRPGGEDPGGAAHEAGWSEQDIGSSPLVGFAQRTVKAALDVLVNVAQVVIILSLIPFYFYFFSVGFPKAVAMGKTLLPKTDRAWILELLTKMDAVVAGFVRGRIIIALIDGIVLSIGWAIVGVPYAIVIGLLTGLLSLVPFLGGVGIPLALGLKVFERMTDPAAADMSWWWVLIGPVAVYCIMQLIENYILIPVIAGKATNLGPVTILVAVLAGGSLMGAYGMLLAIPVAACLKIVMTDVLAPRIKAWTRGEVSDPLPIGKVADE